jgi:hypothetical protein
MWHFRFAVAFYSTRSRTFPYPQLVFNRLFQHLDVLGFRILHLAFRISHLALHISHLAFGISHFDFRFNIAQVCRCVSSRTTPEAPAPSSPFLYDQGLRHLNFPPFLTCQTKRTISQPDTLVDGLDQSCRQFPCIPSKSIPASCNALIASGQAAQCLNTRQEIKPSMASAYEIR